ncbi:putative receptor protein kinase ZmPK1 [Vicia villosa]|uniref:putative receptor protein kinase ZmPK1 n=1 Tax=Vicia villosa TaxID=3911 RepID=UPI00273AABB1|nr:putative receptor protein kinase ZmPK1 [Vicia villosa]
MMRMASSQILITFLIVLFHFQHSSSFSLSVEKPQQDIIVSPTGTFTAGFYPVGENAYSFAIWFTQKHKNLDKATVVWMANRDQPVNGKRSTLSLLKTGNLVLSDAGYSNVWSTNTNSSKLLELFLSDTGNLILRERSKNDSILWQSFDFPTDTLLPDQKFSGYMNLVSSKSGTNYSSGFYKLFFDSTDFLILLYGGPLYSTIYWDRSYSWDTSRSYNNSRVAKLGVLGDFISFNGYTLMTSDYGTVLQRRLTLDFDGNVRVYSRKHGQEKWSISGQFHQQPIKIYGICGPNSFCINNPRNGRKCLCIPGYSRIDSQDWSQGCKPSFQLSCNNKTKSETRFQHLPHVQFQEDNSYGNAYYYYQANYTYKQCKHLCLRMCQCIAFEYRLAQDGEVSYDCYVKTQLQNGYSSPDFQGSTFLRLPKRKHVFLSENVVKNDSLVYSRDNGVKQLRRSYVEGKENGLVKFMLWFATGLGVIEVLCFFMVGCFLFKNRKPSSVANHENILAAAIGFRNFSYWELKQATADFSQEIGRGAGGTVYKGVLSDNRVVAIKCLHETNQGDSEFLAEVSIIGRLNHMNLIEMWGYCAEGEHRLLVYEYMKNGSLAENLSSNALDWGKRFNIALGTAKALAYLHEECLEWILHCDIKPQNILIDSDYQPKVADFGLSKLLQRNNVDNSSISRMRGTRGYMAPEWVFNLPITSKVDVYSYGVVVLEMITGKNTTTSIQISENGMESPNERLVTWVREKRKTVSEVRCWVEQIVDPSLGSNYDIVKLETLATVALDCVEEEKDVRPTMSQVVERLQSHEHDS